eukprot:scaffold858_cov123-Cylindrotheca_fusiformis.AAC.31
MTYPNDKDARKYLDFSNHQTYSDRMKERVQKEPAIPSRDEERNIAIEEANQAMRDLQPYKTRPLSKQDKVLVMQGWNKALAFSSAFSEALLIYWRLICCAEVSEHDSSGGSTRAYSYPAEPMALVEKNKDPIYLCLRDRIEDAETLLMGLLDGAIRSLCPAHQVVHREAFRPMQDNALIERANGELSLECQSVDDHLALFARLGVKPEFWVRFILAVHWTMSTHAPYAQDDDVENLELGASQSALGRVVALYVAIPAIQTHKELTTLYMSPLVHKVQEVWNSFSSNGRADFGEIFYRKLLTEHPQLIDYFAKTDMDSLAVHLSMSLDMCIKNVHAMGAMNTTFRSALEQLAEVHRRMNVPTYSYVLVGATILECFQPKFEQEEAASRDSENPFLASDLRATLAKVYSEIMSLVYYPTLKQEKKIAAARGFYEQVKEELNWSENQLERRLVNIEEEVQRSGTYIQTTEELEVGARLAWRNASKCVGRIAWNTLVIRDCRHISDPNKMCDEMRNHLLEATAGTNIQSVMTVFKPQEPSEVFGTRFWSSQLVRYAAYKNMFTGEVIGDPANLALTEYLVNNGLWEPPEKVSQFDVLPLVLKVPGEKPFVKKLPEDCIFEVDLEHPDRPELSKLGLRWTTVPAISNFKMNLGGVVYQNMPFNGWFVSTEIVRNLMERYDVGPKIAEVIGIDIETDIMWRQAVSCELERMVVHSFQKHKFTIVDPMTVGRQFCTHVQREREQFGRECPAQWSWIGGLLGECYSMNSCFSHLNSWILCRSNTCDFKTGPTNPTWHLECRDYLIKPQYEYCSEGMLLHAVGRGGGEYGSATDATDHSTSDISDDDFEAVPTVLILYGSQTGNAEAAARRLKRELRLLQPTMMTLNEAKGLRMLVHTNYSHILVVCSTFGDGNPPTNARQFFDTQLPKFSGGQKFAVLGLGSTIYPQFCLAAENLERLLQKHGLEPIATLVKADEATGADSAIENWIHLVKSIILPPNIEVRVKEHSMLQSDDGRPSNSLRWLSSQEADEFVSPVPPGGSLCLSNDELAGRHAARSIRKVTFKSPAKYASGDHLSVMPVNSDSMMRRFLQCFHSELESAPFAGTVNGGDLLEYSSKQPFGVDAVENMQTMPADVFFETPTTLDYLLKHVVDLTLSHKCVVDLVELVKELIEKRIQSVEEKDRETFMAFPEIQSLLAKASSMIDSESSIHTEEVDSFISMHPTVVDFLENHRKCLLEPVFGGKPVLEMAEVLCVLPRLQPRFYSISSSNKVSPENVSITVGVLRVETSSGVKLNGVCSNFLARLKAGEEARIAIHKSSFRLPSDPQAPIMMVSAGTGIAPMMGFLDEKALAKKNGEAGSMIHLFYGCRTLQDFIYRSEIEEREDEGLVECHLALSRSVPRAYVQDKITKLGKDTAALLLRKDTHYYVCGDASMANMCYEHCIDVLRKYATMSRVGAAQHLKQMQVQGRWQTDVWGIISNYETAKKDIMNSKRKSAMLWMQHFQH